MKGEPIAPAMVAALLVSTAVTGVVDAISFLSLGHVFTANMTGNVVFLGFAFAGTPGLSIPHSSLALVMFGLGAIKGGRLSAEGEVGTGGWLTRAFIWETLCLLAATASSIGFTGMAKSDGLRTGILIAVTAFAMGLRNAVVRKLAVPDLTTTVLTLTITGIAADSRFAKGENPRLYRRIVAVLSMLAGAALGAVLVRSSLALPFGLCAAAAAGCAVASSRMEFARRTS